jgi:hypothetical protein
MMRSFFWGRFIELIKERYLKKIKLIESFDLKKSDEKTKCDEIPSHPYGRIIVNCNKKRALDYSKLIEICVY